MPIYGLTVKNSAGSTIIDGVYKNYSLYESGSFTFSGFYQVVTLGTATPLPIIVAIKPPANYVFVKHCTTSGGNYTGFQINGSEGETVYWKAYVAHPTTKAGNYGLLVYNAAGELCFDGARESFKIYQVNTGISLGVAPSGNQTITHNGIENPYYFLSPQCIGNVNDPGPPRWTVFFRNSIKQVSSTSVNIGWLSYDIITGIQSGYTFNPNQTLIVLK